ILLSLAIILANYSLVPDSLWDILSSAFSAKSLLGGAAGFSVREAMRYGILRGIFSNEAGCGTSPTAHASADAVSPVHQGCLGVIEVVFDTIVLCTLSALVFLIAEKRYGYMLWGIEAEASKVTLDSFHLLGNTGSEIFITLAIILFAYSTIIAQFYYGTVAVRFLSDKKEPQIFFSVISAMTVFAGSVMFTPAVWLFSDIVIGIMTAVNCIVIILLRRKVKECSQYLP
ncbi:MAG: sodium:alanine symporter family protein, partial [Clostridia bacterium]|nr:sodium:alanine symporter family protein [Clostridia bacterium]